MEIVQPQPSTPPREDPTPFYRALWQATPVAWVTPLIVVANAVVFVLMVASGVSIVEPTGEEILKWGGDFGPSTFGGERWRILTCAFVHIGIIHIALNMWCLWDAGRLTERLFGNGPFLLLYLFSAVGGSLASVIWNPLILSAGASGAVFGVYGGLLAFFVTRRGMIPPTVFRALMKSALGFVVYNVIFGSMIAGIDNAAHLGGLATGFAAGACMSRAIPVIPRSTLWRYARGSAVAVLLVVAALWAQARVDAIPNLQRHGPEADAAESAYNAYIRTVGPILDEQDAIFDEKDVRKTIAEADKARIRQRYAATMTRLVAVDTSHDDVATMRKTLILRGERMGEQVEALLNGDAAKAAAAAGEVKRLTENFSKKRDAFAEKYGLSFGK